MSSELVETSRLFARRNATVKPDWIEEAAEHLVQRNHSEPHWSAKRGATVATERVTLFGIPLVTGRTVDYGRIDPALCRELFIRGALVEGDWTTRHRFWNANRAALTEAEAIEERSRRRGLVIDDEGLFAFYDARVPPDITSVRHFDSWWKKASRQTPDLLTLTPADIRVAGEDLPDEEEFPLRWSAGPEVSLNLSYAFEPGAAADGVTVDVPLALLPELDPAEVPGAAPGLRGELVTALLRSPAKQVRKQLGPAPNLAPAVLGSPELTEQPILEAVAAAAARITGVRLTAADWDLTRVPMHLLPRYRIVDETGKVLGEDRDLAALQRRHAPDRARMLARAADDVTVAGATSWTFGAIPETVERVVAGVSVTGYPALVDRGASVDLAVLPDPEQAARAHLRGVRRLVALAVPNPAPRGHSGLDMSSRLVLGRYPHGGAEALLADCADAAIDMLLAGPAVRDAQAFAAAVSRITLELPTRYAALLGQVVVALGHAWEAERAVDALTSPVVTDAVADIRSELDRLVGPHPVSRMGAERIADLRRYLQALAWRAAKLPDDPAADSRRRAAAHTAEALVATRVDSWPVPDPMAAGDPAGSARRLIDEYRVSLFAQHIRTAVPVSERRIEKFVAGLTV
jgi:ATP-dependent helicase HrpA